MIGILRSLGDSWRDRQKRLAQQIAIVKRLNHAPRKRSVGRAPDKLTAWEEIFARPEWQEKTFDHAGHCGLCGSPVDRHMITCGQCGARWSNVAPIGDHKKQYLFLFSAITLSILLGFMAEQAFNMIFTRDGNESDFVSFVASYLWVTCSLLLMLSSTYLYEKLDLASHGTWSRPDLE